VERTRFPSWLRRSITPMGPSLLPQTYIAEVLQSMVRPLSSNTNLPFLLSNGCATLEDMYAIPRILFVANVLLGILQMTLGLFLQTKRMNGLERQKKTGGPRKGLRQHKSPI